TKSVLVGGNIGAVVIGHDIRGGDAAAADISETGVITAAKLGKVVVGGSILAGSETGAGQLNAGGALPPDSNIGSLTIKGSIVGNIGVAALVSATAGIKTLTVA